VFEQARAQGRLPAILILEDDVRFLSPMNAKALSRLAEQVRSMPQGWDLLMLGHSPMGVPGTCRPAQPFSGDWSVWRVNSFMLHAYVLSERGAQLLMETPYHRYASVDLGLWGRGQVQEHFLDDWLRQKANMYAVVPMLAVQADTPSDQAVKGKEFGIRLHARLARHLPFFLETLFMFIPLLTLVLLVVVACIYLVSVLRFAILPIPNSHTSLLNTQQT
jgi:hypothetical protein